jgi:hypothetical protein
VRFGTLGGYITCLAAHIRQRLLGIGFLDLTPCCREGRASITRDAITAYRNRASFRLWHPSLKKLATEEGEHRGALQDGATKAPVEMLTIDHVERPTEN